jgi:hypothetical protein
MVRAGKQPAKRPARRNGDRPAPEPEPAPSPATPVDLIITTTAPSAPPAAASSSTRKQFNASAMTASTSPSKTPNAKKRKSFRSDDQWKVNVFHGVHQKGPMIGKPSGNTYLIIKSVFDDNNEFKRQMKENFDIEPKWSKERKGFAVKVNSARRAHEIYAVCRSINNASRDLVQEHLDLNGWIGAPVEIIKLIRLNIVMWKGNYTNATALMLNCDKSLFDLKDLLFAEKFEYVRGVNGHEGVDRYVRILEDGEEESMIAKVEEICAKFGFDTDADFEPVDASTWATVDV